MKREAEVGTGGALKAGFFPADNRQKIAVHNAGGAFAPRKRTITLALIAVFFSLSLGSLAVAGKWTSNPEAAFDKNDYFEAALAPIEGGYLPWNFWYTHFLLKVKNLTDKPIFIVWQRTLYLEYNESSGLFYQKDDGDEWRDESKLYQEVAQRPDGVVLPNSEIEIPIYPWKRRRQDICILDWSNFEKCGIHPGRLPQGHNGIFLSVKVMELSPPADVNMVLTTYLEEK
jgi:hypothetical protein